MELDSEELPDTGDSSKKPVATQVQTEGKSNGSKSSGTPPHGSQPGAQEQRRKIDGGLHFTEVTFLHKLQIVYGLGNSIKMYIRRDINDHGRFEIVVPLHKNNIWSLWFLYRKFQFFQNFKHTFSQIIRFRNFHSSTFLLETNNLQILF